MKRLGPAALSIVVLELLSITTLGAESLYVIAGGGLGGANIDGSGLEVVTSPSSPHCDFWDFAIDTNGAPCITYWCSTPIENRVVRWANGEWEELLWFGGTSLTVSSLELADWLLPMVLYYSKDDEIRVMALDRSFDLQIVADSGEYVLGLDVDSTNDKIYWVRVPRSPAALRGLIMRTDQLPQSPVEIFVSLSDSQPNDVSVDEVNGMVYWSSQFTGTIQRAPVADGQSIETVLQGLDHPTGIAVHSGMGKIYWAEAGGVRRSNLDGTMIEDVLDLSWPYRIGFGPDASVGIRQRTWGHVKKLYRDATR